MYRISDTIRRLDQVDSLDNPARCDPLLERFARCRVVCSASLALLLELRSSIVGCSVGWLIAWAFELFTSHDTMQSQQTIGAPLTPIVMTRYAIRSDSLFVYI